jgi:hypothetical protein
MRTHPEYARAIKPSEKDERRIAGKTFHPLSDLGSDLIRLLLCHGLDIAAMHPGAPVEEPAIFLSPF